MSTENLVSKKESTLKLRWPKIESLSSRNKICSVNMRSLSLIKRNKEKSVNRLISNSTKSSTSSGTRISSKPRKKMLRHLVNSKIDTLKKLNRTDNFWKKNCH